MSVPSANMLILSLVLLPILTIPTIIIIVGAVMMRKRQSYAIAILGAIFAILTPPGFLVGMIFGIWALIVLMDRNVRSAFKSGIR